MKRKDDGLVSTAAAATYLQLSSSQFSTIVRKCGMTHDGEYKNPHYKSGPPAKLWARRKLAGLRRRKAFRDFVAGAASRSAAAMRAVETKSEQLMAECRAWVPRVTVLPFDQVQQLAIEHFNDRKLERDPYADGDRLAYPDSDPGFLDRITNNYIRHRLTDYEEKLANIRGRVGSLDAFKAVLRPLVDEAVQEAYPKLGLVRRQYRLEEGSDISVKGPAYLDK